MSVEYTINLRWNSIKKRAEYIISIADCMIERTAIAADAIAQADLCCDNIKDELEKLQELLETIKTLQNLE